MMARLSRARALLYAAPVLAALLNGCTTVGSGSSAPGERQAAPELRYPDVSGEWSGFLSVEGQTLDGTLRIDQTGPALTIDLEAPGFDLTASGQGSVDPDGAVVADLAYETQCPGVALLRGQRASDGLVLEGSLSAEDCTGRIVGSFSFKR
jgi:hypothetical protein